MYTWNDMYNFIMSIKHNCNDKTASLYAMCRYTDNNDFLSDVNLTELDTDLGHLVLIKYNLLNGMTDIYTNPNSIYREGRSLVINLTTEEIVLCPFRKFFNINEIPETSMKVVAEQIKSAKQIEFSDKLDGSMQQYRWYKNRIVYSGSSSLSIDNSPQLKEGVGMFFSNDHYTQLCKDYPDWTFLFECITESDKHIVNYSANSLSLIGARNVFDGKMMTYHEIVNLAKTYHIPSTTLESTSLNELINKKSSFKACEKEGWVINIINHDGSMNKYKFKCDDYVAIHHLLDQLSSHNTVIKALQNETYDDLIAQVPAEYRDRVDETASIVRKYMKLHNEIISYYYDKVKDITSNKEFALAVNNCVDDNFKKFMFMKRKNQSINVLNKLQGAGSSGHVSFEYIKNFIEKYENMYNEGH